MSHTEVLTRYEQAATSLNDARSRTADIRAQLQEAEARQVAIEAELAVAREAIYQALGARVPSQERRRRTTSASGAVPPAVMEVLLAMPDGASVRFGELLDRMKIPATALRTRIMTTKKLGLCSTDDWGSYALTEAGQRARGPRLVSVSQVNERDLGP